MFRNYLKVTLRNIKQHKGYSFINIAGLAVGLACCILIMLWVQDELSYDQFHVHKNDLYRVIYEDYSTDNAVYYWPTCAPLAPAIKDEFPEIIKSTRFKQLGRVRLIKYKNKKFLESRVCLTDPDFFEMFSFPFLKGNARTAFLNPNSIILTESMAEKYFGNENPIGKTLTIDNEFDFTVTGVLKNIPHNSHFHFDFLAPFVRIEDFLKWGDILKNWNRYGYATYVLLQKNTLVEKINNKIANYLQKHTEDLKFRLSLQPVKNIHLYSSHILFSLEGQGDIRYVYVFSIIALFVLLIACINFMNLATARSENRAREVGVRKVVGAPQTQLIKQFFLESIFMAALALCLAIFLVGLFLPAFRSFSGKPLSLDIFGNIRILSAIICITLVTGLLSGVYPALYLSSLKPVKILRGTLKTRTEGSLFRKILVISQFSLSILLIISTTVVSRQVDYMRNKKLGLDKEHLVYLQLRRSGIQKYESLKSELLKEPGVLKVTVASNVPTSGVRFSSEAVDWEGKDPNETVLFNFSSIGNDYIKTFDIEIIQGRSFSKDYSLDTDAVVINETAAKAMGMENPVGKRLLYHDSNFTIIGVVKDFHFKSLRSKIEPLILINDPDLFRYMFIKPNPGCIPATLAKVKDTWKKFFPDTPFEYHFLDESYDRLYKSEQRMGTLFNYFTALAIFISCLGLFGLASFLAEKRTKEIGIRKVLGASVSGIVFLLNKQFIKWVLIANFFAWPIAYYVMNRWLQNFAYRIGIGVWSFLLAALLAIVIALLTVSFQAIRAALTNPVEALRYE